MVIIRPELSGMRDVAQEIANMAVKRINLLLIARIRKLEARMAKLEDRGEKNDRRIKKG
jgi:hypothetical protein